MEGDSQLLQQYSQFSELLAQGRWREVSLRFDESEREFKATWNRIYEEFGQKPQEAPVAAHKLIGTQSQVTSLTLAMARNDTAELFNTFKRVLEFIMKETERMPGYPAIAGVPHIQAGFLYMTATVMALHWQAWNLLEKLLTAKFEWYYHSGRPMFSYTFDLPYFFHSEALGRDAAKIHDLFRKELLASDVPTVTGLSGERTLDAYIQAQALMCLKATQLRQNGEMVSIWPDFGRFYGERVAPLFDRAYADRDYAKGLLRAFREDPDTFFNQLNDRLKLIQSYFWRGSPYFYESLTSWEPARQ